MNADLKYCFYLINAKNKCKETTAVKLAYYFAVNKDTIFRDVDFLNRYNEEKLLKKLSANLDDTAKYYINNILNKYSKPRIGT